MMQEWWYRFSIWNNCEFQILQVRSTSGLQHFWGKFRACY